MTEKHPQPVYKRELKFSNGKLEMNQKTFVPISKDFSEILKRLDFLKELSGADGVVLMDGLELPSFLEWLSEYINSKEFLDEDIKILKL